MSKRILIIEDEPLISDDLEIIITSLGYTVDRKIDNAEEGLEYLNKNSVDLVLLDVQLNGERDGISIGDYLNNNTNTPFIYITSFFDDDTIFRARKTNPSAYLVKPFKDSDIKANISLAFNKTSRKKEKGEVKEAAFFVREKGEIKQVNISTINWIKGVDNYSDLCYENGKKHTVTQTLKSLEEKFSNSGFIRVHKSYVINLSKISAINGQTIYIGSEAIPIGKTYRKPFFEHLTIL